MQFFKLTHPEYRTGWEASDRNPVISAANHTLPGILCDRCGPWSSSKRLRVSLPAAADNFLRVRFLPVCDWNEAQGEWARVFDVTVDDLTPGAEVGPPTGHCTAPIREDAVHPIPGEMWVVSRVWDEFTAANLTGVSFTRVELSGDCSDCSEVNMWELVVHGKAWRKGSTVDGLRLCDVCGRRGFPSPTNLLVDEARWDGSDFVILDDNPNIIVVTERVSNVLDANGFSNLVAIPID